MVWVVTTVVQASICASGVTLCFSSSVAVSYGLKFWIAPCDTSASEYTMQMGASTHSVPRVRSTQKLPSVLLSRREMPRMNAIASAMPVAADQKLCVANPNIWVR